MAILAKSIALSLVVVVAAMVAMAAWLRPIVAAQSSMAALQFAADMLLAATLLIAGWLIFRALALAIVGLYADAIVARIEARDYPGQRATALGIWPSLRMGVASVGRLLLVNILASPLYLVLLVTGVGTIALAFALNAWLLGRDLAAMVASRHPDLAARPQFARQSDQWWLGGAAAGLFSLPLVNFLAPVLATAMAVHMFHGQNGAKAQ